MRGSTVAFSRWEWTHGGVRLVDLRRRGHSTSRFDERYAVTKSRTQRALQTVRFLVENGAEVDALDMGENTALHWAAMRGHVEIVNFLLQNGANKNMKNAQDKLPIDMCQAIWSDSYKYVKECLA